MLINENNSYDCDAIKGVINATNMYLKNVSHLKILFLKIIVLKTNDKNLFSLY